MKKLFVLALLVVGMNSFAQEKISKREKAEMERLSPEQRQQLQLKQLTLQLDLNASQQKEMSVILADVSKKREAAKVAYKSKKEKGTPLTTDERFEMKSKMLDEKIALKAKVKKVLNPEQMMKWEKMQQHRKGELKKKKAEKLNNPKNTIEK